MSIQPYLFFGGRCEEALEFYRTALGADVQMLMRFKDSPEPPPAGKVPAGFEDKIMHATFRIRGATLMASDGCGEERTPSGFALSLSFSSEAEADRDFAALAQGGEVQMPMSRTFWSPRFGMLTDRFGIAWMVNVVAETDAEVSKDTRELVIARDINAPRARVFEVWTERLPEWWGPRGMTTPLCEMDLRAGGVFRTVMRDREGKEYPTKGVFLEVAAPERIVFTDAFGPGWEPDPDAFFTAIITLDELPEQRTRYTARALHWSVESRRKHEEMGFHAGWAESLDRLVELVKR